MVKSCSLDTNVVAMLSVIYNVEKEGLIKDKAYSRLASEGFSYGVDVFRRLCKLLDAIEKQQVKPYISPIVLTELSNDRIEQSKRENIITFLQEQDVHIIDTSMFDYSPLVDYYMSAQGKEDVRVFKEKSINDAYIMAHSTYAGLDFVTCNYSDFTKGSKPERIAQRNREFYNAHKLEGEEGISSRFKEVKPYTPYHFTESLKHNQDRQM